MDDALGVAPADVVFLDDSPECVDGARAVGMNAIVVDPLDRRPAFDEARRLLAYLGSPRTAEVKRRNGMEPA